MSQPWRDRFSGYFTKPAFKLFKALFKDALYVASQVWETFHGSLEGRCVPGKHLAILGCLCSRGVSAPRHHSKLGNYFAGDAQPKNDFRTAFTELRYLHTTAGQQENLLNRIAREINHLAAPGVHRARGGQDICANRTGKTRK